MAHLRAEPGAPERMPDCVFVRFAIGGGTRSSGYTGSMANAARGPTVVDDAGGDTIPARITPQARAPTGSAAPAGS